MSPIKSLEELKRVREQALEKRQVKSSTSSVQIVVAMGTCGIAAGARETMKTILNYIEQKGLSGISVTQTGCMGMCEREPLVQVITENGKTLYGKVSAQVAEQIMQQHVLDGKPIQDYIVQI